MFNIFYFVLFTTVFANCCLVQGLLKRNTAFKYLNRMNTTEHPTSLIENTSTTVTRNPDDNVTIPKKQVVMPDIYNAPKVTDTRNIKVKIREFDMIPLIQKRLDNSVIKKALDDFTMVRKKTFVTLPAFEYNPIIRELEIVNQEEDYNSRNMPMYPRNMIHLNNAFNYVERDKSPTQKDDIKVVGKIVIPNRYLMDAPDVVKNNYVKREAKVFDIRSEYTRRHDKDIYENIKSEALPPNKINDNIETETVTKLKREVDEHNVKSNADKETTVITIDKVEMGLNKPEVLGILQKQNQLMLKLLQNVHNGQLILRQKIGLADFDNLLQELDDKQNKLPDNIEDLNKRIPGPITEKTTTKLSTVMTLIDEGEIRKALRNDPHVQRILQMASLKREQYLQSATKKN